MTGLILLTVSFLCIYFLGILIKKTIMNDTLTDKEIRRINDYYILKHKEKYDKLTIQKAQQRIDGYGRK